MPDSSRLPVVAFVAIPGRGDRFLAQRRGEFVGLVHLEVTEDLSVAEGLSALSARFHARIDELSHAGHDRKQSLIERSREVGPWGPGQAETEFIFFVLPHSMFYSLASPEAVSISANDYANGDLRLDFTHRALKAITQRPRSVRPSDAPAPIALATACA